MKTATFIRTIEGFNGEARLYRLSDPLPGYGGDEGAREFVIASAAVAYSGPETYLFPANESGEVTDWGELPGSFRGALDHDRALNEAGYEVISAGGCA